VMTDTGKLAIDVPRDRQSSFDPQLIAKYQRRFPGFDDKIVSMYARGMSTCEITRHLLAEVAGEQVAAENAKSATKVQRGIVRDSLSGTNGRVNRDSWVPPGWVSRHQPIRAGAVSAARNAHSGWRCGLRAGGGRG